MRTLLLVINKNDLASFNIVESIIGPDPPPLIESRIMYERNVTHGALSLLVYMLDCLFASVPPARPFQTVEDRVKIKHPKTELKHPNLHS